MIKIDSFTKQSSEQYNITIDFSNNLSTGETINTYTVIGKKSELLVTDDIINSDTNTIDSVVVEVKNGVHNSDYVITVTITTTLSNIYEKDIQMEVRDY